MTQTIHHIWFDLEETLTIRPPEFERVHTELKYRTYAEVVGEPVTEKLKAEYEALRKEHGSNSAVFRALGLPSDYWQQQFSTLDETKYYQPVPEMCETLQRLKAIVPISLFTNVKLKKLRARRIIRARGLRRFWRSLGKNNLWSFRVGACPEYGAGRNLLIDSLPLCLNHAWRSIQSLP